MQAINSDFNHMRTEILNIIEQYLIEEKKGKEIDEQLKIVVYNLFGRRQFDDYIEFYYNACVKTLTSFGTTTVGRILKEQIGDFQFNTLCRLLERMVECCWDIKSNKMFIAELDQLLWETDRQPCSIGYIKSYKRKYERLLRDIKVDRE